MHVLWNNRNILYCNYNYIITIIIVIVGLQCVVVTCGNQHLSLN